MKSITKQFAALAPASDQLQEELSGSFLGRTYPLREIIRLEVERERYFLCSLGFVLRIINAGHGSITKNSNPSYLEIFDFEGRKIADYHKRLEPNGMFMLKIPSEIQQAEFFELGSKPSIIENTNINRYRDLVDAVSLS